LCTSIGISVPDAVSTNTSAVPIRNSAPSTTAMLTTPVRIVAQRATRTTARSRLATTTRRSRSNRSAIAPAWRPNRSHGSIWSSTAIETSAGERDSDATRRGPAASAMPSPRLEVQLDASSHRNGFPRRAGATASRMRPTSGDATQQPVGAPAISA
jgi:hypothetical protein